MHLSLNIFRTEVKFQKIEPQKHENPVEKIINRDYTEDEQKISDILNEYVAPAVENDGENFTDGIRSGK